MTFKYAPFNASPELAAAAKNNPALSKGARGLPVKLVQAAFVQLGYSMPRSFKNGLPDGIYGSETVAVVEKFQVDHRDALGPNNPLKKDGSLGRNSMKALDEVMAKHSATATPTPKPKPKPKPAPIQTAEYDLGTADPKITPDPGAGKWNSKPTEISYTLLKHAILEKLPHAAVIIGVDAARHMAHYLGNSGGNLTINLEGMLREVQRARELLEDEIGEAQRFVEKLPPGTHKIRSRQAEGGYNYKEETWNWFFAIGGYSVWGKGEATVADVSGQRRFTLDFEYKFFDRYNWDAGKSVEIFGITVTDEFMAEFHRQGLAKEFNCYGSVRRKLSWKRGEAIAKTQMHTPVGAGRG